MRDGRATRTSGFRISIPLSTIDAGGLRSKSLIGGPPLVGLLALLVVVVVVVVRLVVKVVSFDEGRNTLKCGMPSTTVYVTHGSSDPPSPLLAVSAGVLFAEDTVVLAEELVAAESRRLGINPGSDLAAFLVFEARVFIDLDLLDSEKASR